MRVSNGSGSYTLDASLAGVERFEFGSFNYTVSDGQAEASGFVAINAVQGSILHGSQSGFPGTWGDTIIGGQNPDVIIGDFGFDILSGGGGRDAFTYLTKEDGRDHIVDFQLGFGGDVLDLSQVANSFGPASNIEDYIRVSNFGPAEWGGTLVSFNPDGTAGGLFYEMALLEGRFDLDAHDLLSQGNLML